MALLETWLGSDVCDSELNHAGTFQIFRTDRSNTSNDRARGGGVAVIVKKEIAVNKILFNRTFHSEMCAVKLTLPKKIIVLIAVYFPPYNTQVISFIETNVCKNIVLIGDFNTPSVQWEIGDNSDKLVPSTSTLESDLTVINQNLESGFVQKNHFANNSGSFLDLAFVNWDINVDVSRTTHETLIDSNSLHHQALCIEIKGELTPEPVKERKIIRNYKNVDIAHLNQILEDIANEMIDPIISLDVDEVALMNEWGREITDSAEEAVNITVPVRLKQSFEDQPPWVKSKRSASLLLKKAVVQKNGNKRNVCK